MQVSEFAGSKPVTIGADDSIEGALLTMSEYGVRRLPVIDGHELIGTVTQADLAKHCPAILVAELVEAICTPSADN